MKSALPSVYCQNRRHDPTGPRQLSEGSTGTGRRRYAIPMMREEERYWVKVSLTIGFVVLVLLLLLISGMVGNMEDIVNGVLETVQ